MRRPWNTLSSYYERTYGEPVYRIGLDVGFSCPNRDKERRGGCAFCDGSGSLAVYQRKGEESGLCSCDIIINENNIREQIERGISFVKRRYKSERIALALQAWSNTYAPLEKLKAVYDEVLSYTPCAEFIVSTRPDCVTEENAKLLASYNTCETKVWVELGLQSANDATLEKINRGHFVDSYFKAAEILKGEGVSFSTHIMLMPCYETRDDYLKTVKAVNESGSGRVKIHNLHIMKNTVMADSYLKGGCIALSSERRHVQDVAFILSRLRADIVVDRLLTESTRARLVAPKVFPDKRDFLSDLEVYMNERGLFQGCLL